MSKPPEDEVRTSLIAEAERAAGVSTWTWDPERGRAEFSPNLNRLLGLPPNSDQSAEVLMSNVHPEDRQRFMHAVAEARQGRIPPEFSYRVTWPDGSLHTIFARCRAAFDADGNLSRIVGTMEDRTEQFARERELRRAKMLLELSQRIAKVGTFVWDPVDDTAEWSPEVSTIFGVNEPLSSDAFAQMVHPDDLATFASVRETVIEKHMAGPVQVRIRRGDGQWAHVVFHVVSSADPQLSPQIGVIQDVTERVQLEQQLRLAGTLESVGRLAAGVAHDFNNLMTVVLASADDLAAERPDERLEEIMDAVKSGAELVQRLLTVGRRGSPASCTLELSQVMRDVASWAPRILGDDVEIALELDEEELFVVADPSEIHQVVLNLLVNARDAMAPGGGTVHIRTSKQEGRARLEVIDQGAGMTSDVMQKALEPFFTTKTLGKGTGLGLSMVNTVVTELGGTLTLSNRTSGGTVVRIELPLAEPMSKEVSQKAARVQAVEGGAVLLVEDDPLVRRATARALQRGGYTVVEASGPAEAETKLREAEPQLVLSDVSMPDGGGLAVADAIARCRPGVPIVFMTGYVPTDAMPGPVVKKPFDPDDLLEVLAGALRSRDAAS